jgi:ADP-ribose pyrophosphatase YjhB (NUDIX family)
MIVELEHQGERGVLVHADRRGYWLLPGGEPHSSKASKTYDEPDLDAAVRELREETGLEAIAAVALFPHAGTYNEHQVFFVRARGVPALVDAHEAPAIGLCCHDMAIVPLTADPTFSTSGLRLINSARQIIERYRALTDDRPALFQALRAVRAASDGREVVLDASKGDWQNQPMPQRSAPLVVERTFSPAEMEHIRRGVAPEQAALQHWAVAGQAMFGDPAAAGGHTVPLTAAQAPQPAGLTLLDTLTISHQSQQRRIEIYHGDLAAMTPEDAVDVLVVSALPDNYLPTRSSLIGALHRRGVSVEALAQRKAEDMRPTLACWLSEPVAASDPGIQFKRVLCFEPRDKGDPSEVIGDIFQCLASLTGADSTVQSVAMPMLAGGVQGVSAVDMLIPLFEAATNWLEHGLPIERLKIVGYSERSAAEIAGAFGVLKRQYERTQAARQSAYAYDLFVSYCWHDKEEVDLMVAELKRLRPGLRVFLDRLELRPGCAWQHEIFTALDQSRKVVTVYSPAYLASKVCREEYNMALFRHREEGAVMLPVYLETVNLPTYMKLIQYMDCRERDRARLEQACKDIVKKL